MTLFNTDFAPAARLPLGKAEISKVMIVLLAINVSSILLRLSVKLANHLLSLFRNLSDIMLNIA